MGGFNTLYASIHCERCGEQRTAGIQFKFGATVQDYYLVGDKVWWGKNNLEDKPVMNLPLVMVSGIADFNSKYCRECGHENVVEDYDLIVEYDVITRIQPEQDPGIYSNDDYEHERGRGFAESYGAFKVLKWE